LLLRVGTGKPPDTVPQDVPKYIGSPGPFGGVMYDMKCEARRLETDIIRVNRSFTSDSFPLHRQLRKVSTASTSLHLIKEW
jgi:hypothetical protein